MVEKEKLNKLIWHLLRGFQEGFSDCKRIQAGLSYKRIIPKSFWDDPIDGYIGILGRTKLKKDELKELRKEVVERIIQEINHPSQKKMYADNYSRLFHALAILGVSKSDTRVPALGKDYMYNIAYCLWALDDGTEQTYEFIADIAWYSAEAVKNNKFRKDMLITGGRIT